MSILEPHAAAHQGGSAPGRVGAGAPQSFTGHSSGEAQHCRTQNGKALLLVLACLFFFSLPKDAST